ncbi:AAA family ATPase [Pseudonocardia bannensis]|uniref:ATP-binding protein n=1 Tax=Pseudonocardia bannensis TaxID=630973 RepID=A0A848DKQ0_9PSEU|nr:AAA family ATPase [Pseudonocardia bannensis]NMH93145.1 ATP-binding protein [Pseudonocardia bannensis]
MTLAVAPTGPVRLSVPGRTLVLVAGIPGAGKSTLLAGVTPRPGLAVLDSQRYRDVLARRLPPGTPYRCYRPLVHLLHRLAIVRAALLGAATVLVHLPATGAVLRTAVMVLAVVTGRAAHLVWFDVDPADALCGQSERGRLVRSGSFARHARRATRVARRLRSGERPPGWADVVVLGRSAARRGLILDTDTPVDEHK